MNELVKNDFDNFLQKLDKAINFLSSEYLSLRAGRANPNILNKVSVNYYGTPTPLNQIANITAPEARMLVISLFDQSALKDAIKAINAADLGVNPVDDGKTIRLVFAQPTEEKRKELTKQVKKLGEDSKVTLRNERRDIIDKIKKLKNDGLSEDEVAGLEKEVQKAIDNATIKVDKLVKDKETEVLSI